MNGRPSKYTDEIASRICLELGEGKSLRTICKADDMPTARTVHNWLNVHESFFQHYAKARAIQADTYFDECIDIADQQEDDVKIVDGVEQTNHDAIARARLRIDTRKWMAGKLRPKVYGDKHIVDNTSSDGSMSPKEPVTPVELARQVAFLLASGVHEK